MNSRECVRHTIAFDTPDRLACDLPEPYGSDFIWVKPDPNPDHRPRTGTDEWNAVWQNVGASNFGEVKDFPLKDWNEFDRLTIPNANDPARWQHIRNLRQKYPDKFLLGHGFSLYERAHFLRGLENLWMDMIDCPDQLQSLLDILVQMNRVAIRQYAQAGFDGFIFADDWGLQNRLMISPDCWRQLWKPFYKQVYDQAHNTGLSTFLHSCGYIVDILDDLIDAGLDVIQMDQQENMTLKLLHDRFAGRITFFCPVDIQNTMARGNENEIRHYCREMSRLLTTPKGGFIAKWYSDPTGAGHTPAAIEAMCSEFAKIRQAGFTSAASASRK